MAENTERERKLKETFTAGPFKTVCLKTRPRPAIQAQAEAIRKERFNCRAKRTINSLVLVVHKQPRGAYGDMRTLQA